MNTRPKRSEVIAILGSILFLACIASTVLIGSTIPQPLPPTPSAASVATAAPNVETIPAADRQRVRELYALRCAGCHGAQGEGMMLVHPPLNATRVRVELSAAEVRLIIAEGAGIAHIMPPYQGVLTEEEIDLLVHWLREGMN
jgi:mono/diheme cytochrome c family protein